MNAKKYLFALFALIASSAFLVAQNASQNTNSLSAVGTANATEIGIDTAQQKLKEVSVDKFEEPGFWISTMSSDDGKATGKLFESLGAKDKVQIADEKTLGLDPAKNDKYVFGTRVDFYRRGPNDITIYPVRPIPVQGISKTISLWVVGRNYNHELYLQLQDFFGRKYELYMGKLNFQGWKKVSVAIPPQSADGVSGIIQRNYHYQNQTGIRIIGFRIQCDPMEAYGSYYFYFDDLRAVTDLFAEDNRDTDDMTDAW
jgi:hypothetical protein